jgi:epoxyqueuosine reductase
VATAPPLNTATLAADIKGWGRALGFQQVGIADIDLEDAEGRLSQWLAAGFHGEMQWMGAHGQRRTRPAALVTGTRRVISVRMDYLKDQRATAQLADSGSAYIARYALGRDYHKIMRHRLQQLADQISAAVGPWGHRVFVDSAPVMEKPLAARAGLGWIGKHTNLINAAAGSLFLLGEIYTDLDLPVDTPATDHCGSCQACIDVCPTKAIVAPYVLDARRCISYLTIELRGAIPVELRPGIGNRIFGCDDCQLFCPWNKFAKLSGESDFAPRHQLDTADLVTLFNWSESEWDARTRGSALRRAGYSGWLRNIAVALGNGPSTAAARKALQGRRDHPDPVVLEHIEWALDRLGGTES